MHVDIYTDGAAREIQMAPEDTEPFWNTGILRESSIPRKFLRVTKRPPITGWS